MTLLSYQRRAAAKLSQDELADKAGVRRETISRIESGKHTTTERVMTKIDRVLRRHHAPCCMHRKLLM